MDTGSMADRYEAVRKVSVRLAAPLHPEDQVIQSMADASPTKWHLAHTTWFFETFVLLPHCPGYSIFHEQFPFLFNSYYVQAGERFDRPRRGMISRPTVAEVHAYRRYVDEHMTEWLAAADDSVLERVRPLMDIGLNHEQQHQELILTDIKHLLSQNPLFPAYRDDLPWSAPGRPVGAATWVEFDGGVEGIGHEGSGFHFDNEGPRHRQFLEPYRLADRPVTNGEYLQFIEDGGYRAATLWLSEGFSTVAQQGWSAPGYWLHRDGEWFEFTLGGLKPLNPSAPVTHVSFWEADAFARWRDARLATEAEWEAAASGQKPSGGFVDDDRLHPEPTPAGTGLRRLFGDVWEWTLSSYAPYPGYRAVPGALGEYNGKFMANQYVLRGGSCATSLDHIRATYRNFFPAHARWQFTGIRLAASR